MASVTTYETSAGTTKYRVSVYRGTDPITGKKMYAARRGFDTEQEARFEGDRLEHEIKRKKLTPLEQKFADIKNSVPKGFELERISVAFVGDEQVPTATYKPI